MANRKAGRRAAWVALAGVSALLGCISLVLGCVLLATVLDGDTDQEQFDDTPIQVRDLNGVTAIAAGADHTLVLKKDGSVWAWGGNNSGQLGTSKSDNCGPAFNSSRCRRAPVQVPGLGRVTGIAAGANHNLAIAADGSVWAWGSNNAGQLGDGTAATGPNSRPVQVSGLSGITAVTAGRWHSLALKDDGTVWAWGLSSEGQLGVGGNQTCPIGLNEPSPCNRTAIQVPGLSGATALAAGGRHKMALKGDSTTWAWGGNGYGQLGDGSTTDKAIPVQVSDLSGVTAVAAGEDRSLALKADGTLWTWGYNDFGQLGDGTSESRTTPGRVHGLRGAVAGVAGGSHNLALTGDGVVWTWGDNKRGQLGANSGEHCRHGPSDPFPCSTTPRRASGLDGVTMVAAGRAHSLALKDDGTVWTWGDNYHGQLGR